MPAAFGHLHPVRQILLRGIVEPDLASQHYIRQRQAGEGFRDRADFEHGIAIERLGVSRGSPPLADNTLAGTIDHTHHNSQAALVFMDARGEDIADGFGIGLRGK